ncbi:MAG: hypothetical protein I3273_00580 [Candidatus Moeniiplasma glomeromycotorum]|nr:hypothetical protein [Candidatus Moeniiplasma glomeromycotorum]MCE8167380.1 hypothetical protein [Candidatus Moeniiplasma glomeromycotorum]MCE8168607.1 hypothetical protein [Candidatus Moeniiplasma glomeromycotorum]
MKLDSNNHSVFLLWYHSVFVINLIRRGGSRFAYIALFSIGVWLVVWFSSEGSKI